MRGGWNWNEYDLDPWETPQSAFFGAAMAALAVEDEPSTDGRAVAALTAYLKTSAPGQPLLNRLAMMWTTRRLPGAIGEQTRREWAQEAFAGQSSDGGWTLAAVGPWKARPAAPASSGSNAYATAFAAFSLLESGAPASEPHLMKALDWLRSHQDRAGGYWDAGSMNKRYPPGSMQEEFMRDAATGYAAAALVKAEPR